MIDFREIMRGRIENALDKGLASHIPLTSEYLADALAGTPCDDERKCVERGLAAKIILERVRIDEDTVLGEPQSDFDKWVKEQDTAMRLAAEMLLDPVQYLTPPELRHAYELQQHEYDKQDVEYELDSSAEDYIEKFGIDENPVTQEEQENMAYRLRKMLNKDADAQWSYCLKEAVTEVLLGREDNEA